MTSEKVRKINEYITLKLEGKDSVIYVNGERFLLCKRIILNIPEKKIDKFDSLGSIDEASECYDHFLIENNIYIEEKNMISPSPFYYNIPPEKNMISPPPIYYNIPPEKNMISPPPIYYNIPPETEFWAHCSNLQAWVENNYDTCILHSNLAFPLLKMLSEEGDPKAKKVFKEEIAKRISNGYYPTIEYLILEDYLIFFNIEELKTIIDDCREKLEDVIYFKIAVNLVKRWLDYIWFKGMDDRIIELEEFIKLFCWLINDPKMLKNYVFYRYQFFNNVNQDLKILFDEFKCVCSYLCTAYSVKRSYDKLIQHCRFTLSYDLESSYVWHYLKEGYYAKSPNYQKQEKLKQRQIKNYYRKLKIRRYISRFFEYFNPKYHLRRIKYKSYMRKNGIKEPTW